ncbi:hypothetical protein SAMN05421756_11514 [Microlunatus flavus]|uniref:Uncharacterized protein n=1 Tax=Microlunatus flavus TaxID=1036181 RepID=A0A1H9NHZ4_9ACTN|nr:hypothetical protein SAMN05421756_11514 [Microlunatus flavus]
MLAVLAGCTPAAGPAPDPGAEVTLSRSGGVAGLRQVLHVRPDGVAVLVGVRGGRLGADRLIELRAALADPALAREAAAARAAADRGGSPPCSDPITHGLRVGELSMSVTEPCGGAEAPATPTFDRLFTLLTDALAGRFDEALRPGDAPALVVRTEQLGGSRGRYTVEAGPDGALRLTRPGRPDERRDLAPDERDALALVAAGLLAQELTSCAGDAPWTVAVRAPGGAESVGPGCAFGPRAVDAAAAHLALVRPFDLA